MSLKFKKPFSKPCETRYLLMLDFDETYYPHACSSQQLQDLHHLEQYLDFLSRRFFLKIGWVTGSGLNQIAVKMERSRMNFSPHFIASDLGTELYEVTEKGDLMPNPIWEQRLAKTRFSGSLVTGLVDELRYEYGIRLQEQTNFGQARYKYNYYYLMESEAKSLYDLKIIEHLSKINGIALNVNRCNPEAGDPDQAYDVDFIPQGTGKQEIAAFMMDHYGVPWENTMAFGDSGNDIGMLKAVRHGYLVGNATDEAKGLHGMICPFSYAAGILHICKSIYQDEPFIESV